jgi:hypothetical protein
MTSSTLRVVIGGGRYAQDGDNDEKRKSEGSDKDLDDVLGNLKGTIMQHMLALTRISKVSTLPTLPTPPSAKTPALLDVKPPPADRKPSVASLSDLPRSEKVN